MSFVRPNACSLPERLEVDGKPAVLGVVNESLIQTESNADAAKVAIPKDMAYANNLISFLMSNQNAKPVLSRISLAWWNRFAASKTGMSHVPSLRARRVRAPRG